MPIDPFAALNAMIRAEAARVRPVGTGTPKKGMKTTERREERPKEERQRS
ncbi:MULTISPECIES: hypothetical protein [unclassified Streptomyces]|nr:hypothetical protein [Streptomyces sp. WM6378]